MSLGELVELEYPVVLAGMGGGIADGALAGAVSRAGGLGTVGILAPDELQRELATAREIAGGGPVAANLLVPFARRAHVDVCRRAGTEVVVLHAGFDRSLVQELGAARIAVLQTVGTPDEAWRALADGVSGLVVQGSEAGGHLVGVEPALSALKSVRAVAESVPLLLAGGIADGDDTHAALDAGADAVVAGTRFLLTEECPAHPAYKQAVLQADRTLETRLFGLGWPMRHRVVPNAATERWCRGDANGPRVIQALQALSVPLARLPMGLSANLIHAQRQLVPLFGPSAPLRGMADRVVEAAALYAGESALRIDSIVSAAEAVSELATGNSSQRDLSPTIHSS